MAKNSKKRRRKNGFHIPVAVVLGFLPYVTELQRVYKYGGMSDVAKIAPKVVGYDGFTRTWGFKYMGHVGTWSIVAGFIASRLATRFGLNRMLANAGIPIVRI